MQVRISSDPTSPLIIEAQQISIASLFEPPEVRPAVPAPLSAWGHRSRSDLPENLGGIAGHTVRDRFSAPGLELERSVWTDCAESLVAVRYRVVNRRSETVALDRIRPLVAKGGEGLRLGGSPAANWQVLCQKRFKNNVPAAVRLGAFDRDYGHATRGLSELGKELSAYDGITGLEADPFLLICPEADSAPRLLAGFLEWDRHLAHAGINTDASRSELAEFSADCAFNGCQLPPGGERTTQWFVLLTGQDEHEMIARYADWVGSFHHVPPPPEPAPGVWCSWQYYGPSFTENDLHENIAAARQKSLPFDVMLIDECWDMDWGNWVGNEQWPSGMKAAADAIRKAGCRPGIWTCPYLARRDSKIVREQPDWLLKKRDGSHVLFFMNAQENFVIDPTYPGVTEWLQETFRRLTHDWGFTYHKMDFTRAVYQDAEAVPYDRSKNLLEAYRVGLESIRKGAGPDAYLSICGGHFGGSLGLADSQRSGSDVYGFWNKPPAMPRIKQNIMRTWMSRLWHVDPDAMMVRRREEPLNDSKHGMLAQGTFTDEEALTIAVNQYIGGQMVCLCERLAEIEDDRLALYRHVLPSVNSPSLPLDLFRPDCPSQMLTIVQPRCPDLPPWGTVTCINWADAESDLAIALDDRLCERLAARRFLAYELIEGCLLGTFAAGTDIPIGPIPPHGPRIVKLIPWDEPTPWVLLGTDLHFSGGGVEIAEWRVSSEGKVTGTLDTPWECPVTITGAALQADGTLALRTATVPSPSSDPSFRLHA
ncbi:MAG: hypothetical protein HN849_34175 [Victivallales bacterium]|nr:hypothetical protein [Victivallales bacterium]